MLIYSKSVVIILFLVIFIVVFGLYRNRMKNDIKAGDSVIKQSNEIVKIADVKYANDCDECKLDIYKKDDTVKNKPIVFFVHGGGWRMGDKSRHVKKGEFFAQENYLFVAIEYPLFPKVDYKEQARKVAQAMKWVYENAENYNGDNNNIILMGHSAGGHLVALISTNESYLQSANLELKNIKETILLDSAGLDISTVKNNAPIVFNTIYEPIFGNNLEDFKKASPINYIENNKNIPAFLIFYSTSNRSTAPNAVDFDKKLTDYKIKSKIYRINSTHEEINENIGTQNDEVTKKILEYLNQSMKLKTSNTLNNM